MSTAAKSTLSSSASRFTSSSSSRFLRGVFFVLERRGFGGRGREEDVRVQRDAEN